MRHGACRRERAPGDVMATRHTITNTCFATMWHPKTCISSDCGHHACRCFCPNLSWHGSKYACVTPRRGSLQHLKMHTRRNAMWLSAKQLTTLIVLLFLTTPLRSCLRRVFNVIGSPRLCEEFFIKTVACHADIKVRVTCRCRSATHANAENTASKTHIASGRPLCPILTAIFVIELTQLVAPLFGV